MKNIASLVAMLLLSVLVVFVDDVELGFLSQRQPEMEPPEDLHRQLGLNSTEPLQKYTHEDIVNSMKYFHTWYLRLLVWDGNAWSVSSVGSNATEFLPVFKTSGRLFRIVPMLVQSLHSNFPKRFKPGSKPFELVFSEADTLQVNCGINEWQPCPAWMPPILSFGTGFRDQTILPSVKVFPPPIRWFKCLMNMKLKNRKPCDPDSFVNTKVSYDDLIPQVIWRGANWPFLPDIKLYEPLALREVFWRTDLEWTNVTNEEWLERVRGYAGDLPPRWKAAIWTLEEDMKGDNNGTLPWINSRFVGGLNEAFRRKLVSKGLRVDGERIEEYNMSSYKYHVDFGGGGGTTWEGTMAKLLAPGLLFHHETPMKDFFYDELTPWVHHVPINTNVLNLKERHAWAESHPVQAKRIAEAGTKFARNMWSKEYMEKKYKELFVDYLGAVVDAYEPEPGVLTYPPEMFKYQVSTCQNKQCRTEIQPNKFNTFRYRTQ